MQDRGEKKDERLEMDERAYVEFGVRLQQRRLEGQEVFQLHFALALGVGDGEEHRVLTSRDLCEIAGRSDCVDEGISVEVPGAMPSQRISQRIPVVIARGAAHAAAYLVPAESSFEKSLKTRFHFATSTSDAPPLYLPVDMMAAIPNYATERKR